MPDFAKMSKEEFPDTKFPYVHIGFERGAERIWKEHYLPLKEWSEKQNKFIDKLGQESEGLREELKNLRKQLELNN